MCNNERLFYFEIALGFVVSGKYVVLLVAAK